MTLEVWFWIFMALRLLYGAVPFVRPEAEGAPWFSTGGSLLSFLCVLILGWAQFGSPVRG